MEESAGCDVQPPCSTALSLLAGAMEAVMFSVMEKP